MEKSLQFVGAPYTCTHVYLTMHGSEKVKSEELLNQRSWNDLVHVTSSRNTNCIAVLPAH
jgi:hypothetical protein